MSNTPKPPPAQAATDKAAPSWRDVLPIHPAANLFPLMTTDELKELGEDIKKNGLKNPVAIWMDPDDGQSYLIDGRNRCDAMELVGVDVIDGNDGILHYEDVYGDPLAYVISANIHRRHLTPEQKLELIAKLIEAQPDKSDRQIAKQVKRDHKTVGAVRANMEDVGRIPHVEKRTDTKGRQQPAKKKRRTADDFRADMLAKQQAKAEQPEHKKLADLPPEVENALGYLGNRRDWSGDLVTTQTEANAAVEKFRHDGARNHFLAVAPTEPIVIDHDVVHWLILTAPPPPTVVELDHLMKCFLPASEAGVPIWVSERLMGFRRDPQKRIGMLLPRELPQATPRDSYRDLLNAWTRTSNANRADFLKFINAKLVATGSAADATTDGGGIPESPRRAAS